MLAINKGIRLLTIRQRSEWRRERRILRSCRRKTGSGYAAARGETFLCKASFRRQPEHEVRLFSNGRIAAPRNVCGTAADASLLRNPSRGNFLQRISSPQGNSTAGKIFVIQF